ncbi:MAG: DNA-processing protein DprA [Lachnospiraceae bacterium]|nr:DNA-processing protein DprA [Lachnospiraceae bacterium]
MIKENELYFIKKLCSVPSFNGRLGIDIINHFGSAENLFSADEKTLASLLKPSMFKNLMKADYEDKDNHYSFVSIYDEEYPLILKKISDPPLGFWYYGKLPDKKLPSVAVIGARDCSDYGAYIAKTIGTYLAKSGVQVISGLARGIDGIAQRAALDSGGYSAAVLGSGVDICYPASNLDTYEKLKKDGCIISTYKPGTKALPINFPPRNRIVSGLCDAVIVIEARQKSGTLITVDMALEQGREVFAVPGRITDRLSDGCNALIGQGANVFLSPEIFLCELSELFEAKKEGEYHPKTGHFKPLQLSEDTKKKHRGFSGNEENLDISGEEKKVLESLSLSPITADELSLKLPEFDYATLSMLLMQLLIDGHISQIGQGSYVRVFK